MEFDLSQIKLSKNDIKRGLVLPKNPSKELAEFIGILTGDGWVSFNTKRYIVSVSGDSRLDYDYLKYVKHLIKNLFNLNIKITKRKGKNLSIIEFGSKGSFNFLRKIGYYKHHSRNIRIPDWITNNNNLMLYFVRGLADTDFSLMLYKNRKKYPIYPIIAITSVCNELIDLVGNWLKKIGFLVYIRKDNKRFDKRTNKIRLETMLVLSGRQNLKLWMKLIGFRNKRHLNKYQEYLASGTILNKIGRPQVKLKALENLDNRMGMLGFELS